MKIKPLASDSQGTRSMATYVETRDTRIIIDPGVALGPKRYGLPPHPLEWEKMEEDWEEIKKHTRKSGIAVITHYHYDHHSPDNADILSGKRVYVKHPKRKINLSQKRRAGYYLSQLEGIAEVEYCDSESFTRGNTEVNFSQPVYHGTSPKLGYVVEVCIGEGKEKFLYSSDVEGPSVEGQVEFILQSSPTTLYIDGPMSYMLGFRYSLKSLEASVENLVKIVGATDVETLILDHHLARDLKWREQMKEVERTCRANGCEFLSAALYSGGEELMLEARRKKLYEKLPLE